MHLPIDENEEPTSPTSPQTLRIRPVNLNSPDHHAINIPAEDMDSVHPGSPSTGSEPSGTEAAVRTMVSNLRRLEFLKRPYSLALALLAICFTLHMDQQIISLKPLIALPIMFGATSIMIGNSVLVSYPRTGIGFSLFGIACYLLAFHVGLCFFLSDPIWIFPSSICFLVCFLVIVLLLRTPPAVHEHSHGF